MTLQTLAQSGVVAVAPSDSVDKALCLMEEYGVHHLPVSVEGHMTGLVSDGDLLRPRTGGSGGLRGPQAWATPASGRGTVAEIMSGELYALPAHATLYEGARFMTGHRLAVVPLTDRGKLVGLVTRSSLLETFCAEADAGAEIPVLHRPVMEFMRVRVFTAAPGERLFTVLMRMHEKQIRHLPVLSEGLLIGMIAERDIRRAIQETDVSDSDQALPAPAARTVADVMSRPVRTVGPSDTLLAAAKQMLSAGVTALPVVDADNLVGIICDSDIIRAVGQAEADS